MPLSILGWVAIVLVCYYAFAVPDFVFGQELFYPAVFTVWYGDGEGASLIRAYGDLGIGYGEPGAGVLAGGFAYDPDNHTCISGAAAPASAMVGMNECSIGPLMTRTR